MDPRLGSGAVENLRASHFFAVLWVCLCMLATAVRAQSHWQVQPSNTNSSLNAVAFGHGVFVAVGDNGVITTSPDGEVWTPRVSGTTDALPAIAFGNGRFVAARANRSLPAITSADGIDWKPVTVTTPDGTPADTSAFAAIAFGDGRFLAAGSGPTSSEVMSSTDGLFFRTISVTRYPDVLGAPITSLTYFRGQFYAYTGYNGFNASTDGVSWKRPGWSGGNVVATDGVTKVAILGSSNPQFSIDAGHTFQRAAQPEDRYEVQNGNVRYAPVFTAACYGAGSFVAVDSKGRVWTSERGEFWLPRGRYAKADEGFRGVAFDGASRFVAVGAAPASGPAFIITAQADPPSSAPPAYTVYRLKDLSNGIFTGEPRSISNTGIIGGVITGSDKRPIGAILRDGVVTTYPDPVYGTYPTTVTSVNDNGSAALEVNVGSGYTLGVALPQNSRTFPGGGIYSTAPSINSSGSIAGIYSNYGSTQLGIYRYDSSSGATTDLGNFGLSKLHVSSINDRGDLAGIYVYGYDSKTNTDQWRPYRVGADGQLTLIPTLGGTFVWDVVMNSLGDVAGASSLPSAPIIVNATHAFLYRDGVMSDIDLFNSRFSRVNGINNQDDVVGEFTPANYEVWQHLGGNAFLYRNGIMYDLNRLLDASGDGWVLYRATSINDKGWIVGQGWLHGDHLEPFLAIPAPGSPAGVQTRFVNVSTRLRTGAGDDVLIGGFIIRGGAKRVVVRALGPSIPGLPNRLADPTLELFNDRGERIAFNDNYTDLPYFPDRNEILGYNLQPQYGGSISLDSVIAVTLGEGNYTAVVRGKDGSAGNCLVEVYNVDTDYTAGLANISTRGPVGTSDDVMIAGFIIRGDRQRRVLIRGLGPSLARSGVPNPLLDPALEIHDANGQIAQNDDWRSDQETEIRAAGFAPDDNHEASVILSLWPGSYTAIVHGKSNSVGNALVEVYTLSDSP